MQRQQTQVARQAEARKKTDLVTLLNRIKPLLRYEIMMRTGDTVANKQRINTYVNGLFEQDTTIKRLMILVGEILDRTAADIKMNKAQINHFIAERMLGEDCIKAAINSILTRFSLQPNLLEQPIGSDDFNLTALIAQLPEELSTSLTDRYKIVDDRVLEINELSVNENAYVRRLNSLARLFRFTDGLSVCSAVTLHNGELLLGCNASKNGLQPEIIEKATRRMEVFRLHLQRVSKMSEEEYHNRQVEINTETCQQLMAIHPSAFGAELTIVALDKITDAILFDPDIFSPEIKAIFSPENIRFRILVPLVENTRDLSILCTGHEKPIRTNARTESVTFVHAEQLLAFYIRKVLGQKVDEKNPESYGVTKLCCQVCRINLGPTVRVVGTHGEQEAATVRLLGKEVAVLDKSTTPKRTITHPNPSPQSASKKREERVLCSSFAKRACFFSSSEEGDDEELPDRNTAPTKKHTGSNKG